MVTVTESAAEAIKALLAAVDPSGQPGLRISGPQQRDGESYDLTVSRAPGPDDRVVAARGVRLFIDPQAAPTLDGKVLDARLTSGILRFAVEEKTVRP
jgi:iron-sulfur cluster assembly protein